MNNKNQHNESKKKNETWIAYISSHLYHMLSGLFRNNVGAVMEHHSDLADKSPPVSVTVVRDKQDMCYSHGDLVLLTNSCEEWGTDAIMIYLKVFSNEAIKFLLSSKIPLQNCTEQLFSPGTETVKAQGEWLPDNFASVLGMATIFYKADTPKGASKPCQIS